MVIALIFVFHSFIISQARYWYFSNFLFPFCFLPVVWLILNLPWISSSSILFARFIGTIMSIPIVIVITVAFLFYNYFFVRFRYLSSFTLSYSFTLSCDESVKFTIWQIFLSFHMTTNAYLLAWRESNLIFFLILRWILVCVPNFIIITTGLFMLSKMVTFYWVLMHFDGGKWWIGFRLPSSEFWNSEFSWVRLIVTQCNWPWSIVI